ncbi:energy transducer TonB [Pendulispora albinea]|uniref:Energy transducer TonB n=1 Tax=Pendulispora albinea TaxID=2741071 RepID=A0ABZ2LX13_9BACT
MARIEPLPKPRTETGEVITPGEGERPRLISGEEYPIFPGDALLRVRSTVVVAARCLIRTDGTVSNCTMVCSDPAFDEIVLQNLQTRRYTPFLFRGRPMDVTYTFPFAIYPPSTAIRPAATF